MSDPAPFSLRRARTTDVPGIDDLVAPLVNERILLGKDRAVLYGALQEFRMADDPAAGRRLRGAARDVGGPRPRCAPSPSTPAWRRRRVGHALLERLEEDAAELGVSKLFCLDLRGDVLRRPRLRPGGGGARRPGRVAELARSGDEGVAEFLDLARVKPNTLGNTRMLKVL